MAKKEKVEMISTSAFAWRMDVNYRTALNWLRAGLSPGGIEHVLPGGSAITGKGDSLNDEKAAARSKEGQ